MEILKIQTLRAQILLSHQKVKTNKAYKDRFLWSGNYANFYNYKVRDVSGPSVHFNPGLS